MAVEGFYFSELCSSQWGSEQFRFRISITFRGLKRNVGNFGNFKVIQTIFTYIIAQQITFYHFSVSLVCVHISIVFSGENAAPQVMSQQSGLSLVNSGLGRAWSFHDNRTEAKCLKALQQQQHLLNQICQSFFFFFFSCVTCLHHSGSHFSPWRLAFTSFAMFTCSFTTNSALSSGQLDRALCAQTCCTSHRLKADELSHHEQTVSEFTNSYTKTTNSFMPA